MSLVTWFLEALVLHWWDGYSFPCPTLLGRKTCHSMIYGSLINQWSNHSINKLTIPQMSVRHLLCGICKPGITSFSSVSLNGTVGTSYVQNDVYTLNPKGVADVVINNEDTSFSLFILTLLSWPKRLFGFFHMISGKNPNDPFGQHNTFKASLTLCWAAGIIRLWVFTLCSLTPHSV